VLGACVGLALVGSKLGTTLPLGMVDTTSLGTEEEFNVGRLDAGTLGVNEEVNVGTLDGDRAGFIEALGIEEGDPPVGTPTGELVRALVGAALATALGIALDETGEALGLDEVDTDGERLA
jgi:hypothetical protein